METATGRRGRRSLSLDESTSDREVCYMSVLPPSLPRKNHVPCAASVYPLLSIRSANAASASSDRTPASTACVPAARSDRSTGQPHLSSTYLGRRHAPSSAGMLSSMCCQPNQRPRQRRMRLGLTALTNHLPPPNSNQPRCPPSAVVHSTPYGVACTSIFGSASSVTTGSSSA
jgi:hypothetical protein